MKFKLNFNFNLKIGNVVRYFVLADLALLAGWGLVEPVFAVFILDRIQGATVITLGLSAAIYWITKSIIQIPVAIVLDKTPGERDDYIVLVSGLILAGISAFSFTLINQVWQLYFVQLLHALAFAFYIPSWNGMFARHLDPNHKSLDYALDSGVIGIASGITGIFSGILATWLGFNILFVLAALFSFVSAVIIFATPELVFPHRTHRGPIYRDHSPKAINQ